MVVWDPSLPLSLNEARAEGSKVLNHLARCLVSAHADDGTTGTAQHLPAASTDPITQSQSVNDRGGFWCERESRVATGGDEKR